MPTPPHSKEFIAGLHHARRLAAQSPQTLGSGHVLLGLFSYPNKARALFAQRNIDEPRLRAALAHGGAHREPAPTLDRLCQRAQDVAQNVGAAEVDCLHLLVAISRSKESEAFRILERTGTSLTTLRHAAVAHMTGTLPRRFTGLNPRRKSSAAHPQHMENAHAPRASREVSAALGSGGGAHHDSHHGHDGACAQSHEDALATPECDREQHAHRHLRNLTGEPHDHGAPTARLLSTTPRAPKDITRMPLDELAPTLAECGTDLTAQAQAGLLDAVIARDKELEALADVLGKRRANNPVLVGPPGVGKTAIVEGLALLWAAAAQAGARRGVRNLTSRRIVALDTGAMVAGTSLRGSFSERLGAIKNEVAQAKGHVVVFIDELHMLIGAGASGEGPQDAAGELKAALARGEFPCIGATTEDEFKRYIEKDPALERRFTAIEVKEPTCSQASIIVRGAIAPYAAHHEVHFDPDAIEAAVQHSHRFVPERRLPDKAFAVLDLAGSRAHRKGAHTVTRADVAQVVNEWTGVPIERLSTADAARFAHAEDHLGEQLIGHRHVVQAVAQSLRRGFAGFNAKRPMGSFLFLGPTGVGKTEMVKVLAEFVFGQRDSIVRFDMSELVEKHAVARLLGAQPGYVGYEEGGQLTEALRKRPFQIVLFDEIEKAHPEVINVLLQILDEGHLTDTQGRRISFAHTVVVLTSNLGAEAALKPQHIGFSGKGGGSKLTSAQDDEITQTVLSTARGQLSPELWSRLDEHLVFLPLKKSQVARIATQQMERKMRGLHEDHGLAMSWDDEVMSFLLDAGGYDATTGARGLRKVIAKHIEAPLAELILKKAEKPFTSVHFVLRAQKTCLQVN